ncbi:alpha-mannosidase II [Apostasia shenzhenica]|uniref:Alpha-mannosidase n=1 Tax=Apostasia shenzhenica TaxID=1088818 RepID=A0A2I0AQV9_9ASPA|nr:alpha-mannosidase II [Apostasia shenzhenica]
MSGNRRGGSGVGVGFGHSLLPTTAKPKPLRKPSGVRRRNPFSPSSTFFALGIFLSLLLFLAVFLRYGVPSHLSSSSSTNSLKSRVPRRTSSRRPNLNIHGSGGSTRTGGEISAASVDITTKDLYDRIEFKDVDGGAWKQGWKVKYEGNEWEEEKLKVFVVPHSHNDPGWKLTVEEYYNRQSRRILDTIVESLSRDTRRKFIWEEMSYLERWWRDASGLNKERFTKLVKNGQLEIVGGGWVMNDEANSHYFAIIEQMMEGNAWLNDTIGVVPKNSWSIDPFGYSATMAYLLRRMGFRNMLIQRTHYEVKKELALNQNLEYIWRQSWDVDESTDIFVHMMPFYSYDVPHTCGPEPAICCQFDFARMHGFGYEYCPWRIDPAETNPANVQERASKLLDQYRKKSTLYRTNTLLVPLGDDFRYVTIEEAEAQFINYQMLFDHINSNPALRTEVKFGTLEDYFSTLRDEAERINYSRPGESGSGELGGFPSLSGDFFTYADRNQDYWSGYYVSRPFFKAVDRVLEQTLRASEMLVAFVLGYCQNFQCSKLPTSFSYKLTAARRNLALFQHHDGVTGTAKDHVVQDYGTRMHTSLQDLQIFLSRAVEVLLGDIHDKRDPTLLSKYELEQTRSKYDVQPLHRVLDIHEGHAHTVVFFNPMEQTRDEIVMIVTAEPDISVINSNGSCISSQISPEWNPTGKEKFFTGRHRLYWKASVPPMGLETYYVARKFKDCEKAVTAEIKIYADIDLSSCPSPYVCSKLEGEDKAEISNALHTLVFDASHGLLHQIINKDGRKTVLGEEIGMYSSIGSGAYLFKPTGEALSIIENGGRFLFSKGPLVQEAYSSPKTKWLKAPVSHSTRIYKGDNTLQELLIEKEYHVDILGDEFNDRELIVRFKTDIDNQRVFYSDLNGFQMSRRETYDKIPLQGNYYPMPSLAFLQDSLGHRFSVHSRQSLGAASLKNGWLEIMLDRRLVNDDGRGLGQGVMDNRQMNVVFHLLVESNVSASPPLTSVSSFLQPSILSHRVGSYLNYPMHIFLSRKSEAVGSSKLSAKSFSPLASSLPCDLHIVSLKVPHPLKFHQTHPVEPSFAILLQRRGWDSSYCRRGRLKCSLLKDEPVNLFDMFKDLSVQNIKATSLNLLHYDPEILGYADQLGDGAQEGNLMMAPMEIQAFKLELQRHN